MSEKAQKATGDEGNTNKTKPQHRAAVLFYHSTAWWKSAINFMNVLNRSL